MEFTISLEGPNNQNEFSFAQTLDEAEQCYQRYVEVARERGEGCVSISITLKAEIVGG